MATQAQIKAFIGKIAPILQKEAKARGYKVVSPAIAQALQESLSSKSTSGISQLAEKYHNYHGMKCGQYWLSQGKPAICLGTSEEYKVGTLTPITDFFRVFSNMESGLKGYYDFLDMKRYTAVRNTATPAAYMNAIKAAGYCTSSTYINSCLAKIDKYNLAQYDSVVTGSVNPTEYYPIPNYAGSSIAEALKNIGIDSSLAFRRKIAQVNGISGYTGTASQNMNMLKLLKEGKLKTA